MMQRFARMPAGKKMLVLALGAFAALCAYRAYDYWVTGFYVSDEIGYVNDAMSGTIYGDRWFFGEMNIALFRLLDITSATRYWLLLPFYLFLWGSVTIYVFYRIMKLLEFDERTIALSLFSTFFLVSFVLLSLGFLTEPVGLCFALVGVYFMIRWLKQGHESSRSAIVNPLVAALSFSAAAGTREPYLIFPVACIFLVPLILRTQNQSLRHLPRARKNQLLAVSALAFIIPSLVFLQYPNGLLFGQVTPTAQSFAGGISQTTPTPQASTTTSVSTITSTITTVVSNTTSTQTVTTTSTHTLTTPAPQPNFLARTRLGNTLLIFLGGIVLGWGPILFLVGAAGFALILMSLRKADSSRWLVFLLALCSLGSYFVVSFIFSTDPFYLSFSNYSTIIRFSDTALPAYFLCAPFILSVLAKKNKQVIGFALVLLLFVVAAVPIYETYASSNLVSYTSSNPFALNFRTDAVVIRNYIGAHPDEGPFNILGYPVGWIFTPGTDILPSTHVYELVTGTSVQSISYSSFIADRWSTVYIYFTSDISYFNSTAPYLLPLIVPGARPGSYSDPFTVTSSKTVLQGSDFTLIQANLSWQSSG